MKNLLNDQEPFDLAIISFILIAFMFNSRMILGEIRYQGLKCEGTFLSKRVGGLTLIGTVLVANKLSVEGSFTDKCFANLNLKVGVYRLQMIWKLQSYNWMEINEVTFLLLLFIFLCCCFSGGKDYLGLGTY